MSQLFTSDGQRIGVSASTSVLPMNTQDWSPLGWTGVRRKSGGCVAQEWRKGATQHPRSGAASKVRGDCPEEIPHVQGKRNPSRTVGAERGHQRADRLKPQSQTTS